MPVTAVKPANLKSRVEGLRGINQTKATYQAALSRQTKKVLTDRFSRIQQLKAKREATNKKVAEINQQYVTATEGVLNKQTLDFLVKHSNIDAPTVTSIMAGFELARASRAERLNQARELQIQQLNQEVKIQQDNLAQQTALDTAELAVAREELKQKSDLLDALQQAREADIKDYNAVQQDITEQNQALEREAYDQSGQRSLAELRNANAINQIQLRQAGTLQVARERIASNERIAAQRAATSAARGKPVNAAAYFESLAQKQQAKLSGSNDSFFDQPLAAPAPAEPQVTPAQQEPQAAPTPAEPTPLLDFLTQPLPGTTDAATPDTNVLPAQTTDAVASVTPITPDVLVDNAPPSPIVDTVFESRQAFDTQLAQDQADTTTLDVNAGLTEGKLMYYENPETGEVLVLTDGQTPPDGFIQQEDTIA